MDIKSASYILYGQRYINKLDIDGSVDKNAASIMAMKLYALQFLNEIEHNVILLEVKYIQELKEKIRKDR